MWKVFFSLFFCVLNLFLYKLLRCLHVCVRLCVVLHCIQVIWLTEWLARLLQLQQQLTAAQIVRKCWLHLTRASNYRNAIALHWNVNAFSFSGLAMFCLIRTFQYCSLLSNVLASRFYFLFCVLRFGVCEIFLNSFVFCFSYFENFCFYYFFLFDIVIVVNFVYLGSKSYYNVFRFFFFVFSGFDFIYRKYYRQTNVLLITIFNDVFAVILIVYWSGRLDNIS